MSSFIPHHTKKLQRLRRLETNLKRMFARNASQEDLLSTAAEIREARIRVLRAKQNMNPERNPNERANFLKLKTRIDRLRQLSWTLSSLSTSLSLRR